MGSIVLAEYRDGEIKVRCQECGRIFYCHSGPGGNLTLFHRTYRPECPDCHSVGWEGKPVRKLEKGG